MPEPVQYSIDTLEIDMGYWTEAMRAGADGK